MFSSLSFLITTMHDDSKILYMSMITMIMKDFWVPALDIASMTLYEINLMIIVTFVRMPQFHAGGALLVLPSPVF